MIIKSTKTNLLVNGVWLPFNVNITVSDAEGASYLGHDGVVEVQDPRAEVIAEIHQLEQQENLPLS
jgi:hypothetical protein